MFSIRDLINELDSYQSDVDEESRDHYEAMLKQLRNIEMASLEIFTRLKSEFELTVVSRIFEDTEEFFNGLRRIGLGCISLFSTSIQKDVLIEEGSMEYIEAILKATQTLIAIAKDLENGLIEEYPQAAEMKTAIENYKAEICKQEKSQLH